MNPKKVSFNLFDLFLVVFVLLTAAAVYFTFVKPIQFSNLIVREGVSGYAEIDFVLDESLDWIAEKIPEGLEFKNVYGKVEWKILKIQREVLAAKPVARVSAKVLLTRESSGLIRYGKYTLVIGGRVILVNDEYLLEGRVTAIRIMDEKILI
jgi:hypothetical protein